MSSTQDNLILFCGGETKQFSESAPKPLLKLNNNYELIINYIKRIQVQKFRKILLLVEKNWVNAFNQLLSDFYDVEIIAVPDSSSTFEKLVSFITKYNDHSEFSVISYPDIFISPSFWHTSKRETQKVYISQKPLTSRFPRIFSSPFNNNVKGVSGYNSKVPANPHFIFAGKFFANTDFLRNCLETYSSDYSHPDLEIGFMDWLASKNLLISETYIDEWIICDSARDYEALDKFFKKDFNEHE